MEAVIFCGIQATGKTTFYNRNYAATHRLISLDQLKTRIKEDKALLECVQAKLPFVVDNTNTTVEKRKKYIELAKKNGYKTTGIYFDSLPDEAIRRNSRRSDEKRVPDVAIWATYNKLETPSYLEGFDQLYTVTMADDDFIITKQAALEDVLNPIPTGVWHFIDVVWKDRQPYLRFYDFESRQFYDADALGKIQMQRLEYKFCTGYYDHQEAKLSPCGNQTDLTHSRRHVCKTCNDLTGFSPCVMCRGNTCKAKRHEVLERCQSDHVLYLAFFPDNKIKVGITAAERRYERMLEQGAIFSLFIARTDGKSIRKLETAISKLGITPQVTQTYKIQRLFDYPDSESAKEILFDKLTYIKAKLPKSSLSCFIEPEFNDFSYLIKQVLNKDAAISQLSLFNSISYSQIPYRIAENTYDVTGQIVAVIGSIAVIENNNGSLAALNFREWCGWLVQLIL